jgi:hypothetical protein
LLLATLWTGRQTRELKCRNGSSQGMDDHDYIVARADASVDVYCGGIATYQVEVSMVVEHGINSPTDPERSAIWCKEKNPQTASKFLHRIVTHSLKVSVSETSSREDSAW